MGLFSNLFGGSKKPDTDTALVAITGKIKTLDGGDKQFATQLITSAWSIIDKLGEPETIGAAQLGGYGMRAWKLLLCHHCMLMFYRDPMAKSAMRRMVSDFTDGDYAGTDRMCGILEHPAAQGDEDDISINLTTALWEELHSLIGAPKNKEPVAIMVIMTHFEDTKSKVRHLFG